MHERETCPCFSIAIAPRASDKGRDDRCCSDTMLGEYCFLGRAPCEIAVHHRNKIYPTSKLEVSPTSVAGGGRCAQTGLVTRQGRISKENATRFHQHQKKNHVSLIRRDLNECLPRRKSAKQQLKASCARTSHGDGK